MSRDAPIRVLPVDDHRVITETLAAVVEAQAAEAGVTSFVAKDSPITAMVGAIRSAAATW